MAEAEQTAPPVRGDRPVAELAPQVAFQTFEPTAEGNKQQTMQLCSQSMMQYVRNTLQTAQEITSIVHEAETVAEEAMRSASAIRDEHAHVDRMKPTTRHLYKFRNKVSNARAAEKLGEELAEVPAPIAAAMTKQIQLSVLHTQQMLELVNMSQSEERIELGARLRAPTAEATDAGLPAL
jgi:hypothetical protein